MAKLIYIAPDAATAETAVNAFRRQGIDDADITVMADQAVDVTGLPGENPEDSTDALPAARRGAVMGGSMGLLAGLTAMAFPPAGLVIGTGAVLGAVAGGATFGVFASALIGTSVDHSRIQQYQEAISEGQLLIIVSLDDEREEAVRATLADDIPQVRFDGRFDD